MENLRILAENIDQKNEIISMFVSIGYNRESTCSYNNDDLMGIHVYADGDIQDVLIGDYYDGNHKEITPPQLRDMVVLKRNDVADATHVGEILESQLGYLTVDGVEYFWNYFLNKWNTLSTLTFENQQLKPIEKREMKEFLVNHDNKWTLKLLDADTEENSFRVAVPSGADWAYKNTRGKIITMNGEIGDSFIRDLVWQRSETEESSETVKVTIDELKHSQWDVQVGGDHYKSMRIQPAKFALENKLDYCQANAIKYICRHDSKGGKQDLEKAKHYIDLLIEHYYGDEDE